MKKSDITLKIIELAKKIAELWRMEIYVGCWILDNDGKPALLEKVYKDDKFMGGYGSHIRYFSKSNPKIYPIPSISDCLEKLKELGLRYIFHAWELNEVYVQIISDKAKDVIIDQQETCFTTLHEALLSALLEVLQKQENLHE